MIGLAANIGGEEVRFEADGSLWWPSGQALFVADLHLGKAVAFRRAGVPVPEGPTAATFGKLSAAADRTGVSRLIVLGDLWHEAVRPGDGTSDELRRWREDHARLEVDLVPGNHDRRIGTLCSDLGVTVREAGSRLGPFRVSHDPDDLPEGETGLAGHLHPVVRVGGRASVRLPCFWGRGERWVLPAFGAFTGGWRVDPRPGDRVVAATGREAIAICGDW
ncbi:MAG: ligase-associated DNA damage response endonuclease PdeM [Fimbriimonadaceae bacterium]